LLRIEPFQQLKLGAESGDLLVQMGQIARVAVALLLEKNDII